METGVKQERFDETEIQNLANKMMEANKVRMTTPAPLNSVQNTQNGTLFHFLTPSKDITVTKIVKNSNVTNLKDDESLRGRFGWTIVNKVPIPYIYREGQQFCSVRVVEMKVLNKYIHCFNQEIYKCACVKSYYVTEAELRLLNEINIQHCDLQFGDQFTQLDLVVRLDDILQLYHFLDTCFSKLLMKNKGVTDRCGFVRINKESVVPYSVSGGEKYVPQFYFEDESDSLKLNIDQLEGWDLCYLKFCCKLQGIREELFAKDSCSVIGLNNIKSYFPPGSLFEDCWPSKIVCSQLLAKGRTQMQMGHWTIRPTEPPTKIHPSAYCLNALPNVQILNTARGGNRKRPVAIQPNIVRPVMAPTYPNTSLITSQFQPLLYANIPQLPPPRSSSNDIPLHATTLTFLLIAWDRYRYVRNPSKPRLPACVCVIGTWLTALCLVLPYPIYITYIDLGKHLSSFYGVGICIVNLADDMQEYMRGIFLIMYAGPLATICYLHVKISRELQTQEGSLAVVMFETRSRESRSRTDSHSTTTDFRGSRAESDGISQFSRGSFPDREGSRARYEIYESELDVTKEKRTQKYLVSMVTMYAIFLCPLMVLRLARLALLETYDNSGHFDITYTALVWFAFLSTCSTPLLFTSWQMSPPAKERLRGYFRFSNRKLRQSCEAVITAAGGTPARRPRASSRQGDPLVRRSEDGHSDSYSFHQDLVS